MVKNIIRQGGRENKKKVNKEKVSKGNRKK